MAASVTTAQNGIVNFFWPDSISQDGRINHHAMLRRMETVLGFLIPCMATTYGVLEYSCHCPHSGMLTLVCSIPIPALFGTVDEYRAESAQARIEALRQEMLKSSQAPPSQLTIPRSDSTSSAETTASSTLTMMTVPSVQPPKSALKNSGGNCKTLSQSTTIVQAGIRQRVGIDKGTILDPKNCEDANGYPLGGLPELNVKSY